MPTEIARPRAQAAGQVRSPRPGSRDAAPPGVTVLVIIAALMLILHVAAGAVLTDPLAHPSPPAPDDDAMCLGDARPPAPALPFD